MPPNVKKIPGNGRRRVTASYWARISTKKVKKNGTSQIGSYLQETAQPRKPSTSVVRMNSEPNSPPSQPSNLDILNVLQRLEASNKDLSDRVNRMEHNSTTSTPLQIRSREGNSDPTPMCREQAIPVCNDTRPDVIDSHPTSRRDVPLLGNFTNRGSAVQLLPNVGRGQRDISTEAFQRDDVLPDLNVLRHIATVTDAVNNVSLTARPELKLLKVGTHLISQDVIMPQISSQPSARIQVAK